MIKQPYKIGLDIGSTTMKLVVLSPEDKVFFSKYERHNAMVREKLISLLKEVSELIGNADTTIHITGSIGMGVAEKCGLQFVQEVVAATNYVSKECGSVSTMIDIGGEDAKVVFFENGKATDLRMNGNCAGGTGAFIDQMAILLGCNVNELNGLAQESTNLYPIASRCGVFSKTDIQNLIAKNVNRNDIAASIFHAVAVQVVMTLAHGADIKPTVLFCGGPLKFIPALRTAFCDYLHLTEKDIIISDCSHLIPAWGSALSQSECEARTLEDTINIIEKGLTEDFHLHKGLQPIFSDKEDYENWKKRIGNFQINEIPISKGQYDVTIGIDSGSTTTKIVVLNSKNELLYSFYGGNNGSPIATVEKGLREFMSECNAKGAEIRIVGSCSTGYGEDLIKSAFRLNDGVIETIAHYLAARHISKDVSFILDIGGQDMKAIFVSEGVINRMEINEACSSGCGSFIETFAKSLDYSVSDFARLACEARYPYDLGTRCTVFMNSKVKQALREGATVGDIAAGLSYSVIKNCLYKVLRLKNIDELGKHIVVQGGTLKNDSVVRAFELLLGRNVYRSNRPELMGAIGCALYAKQHQTNSITIQEMLQCSEYTSKNLQCHGCENQCLVRAYKFGTGNIYYSGNRCEKVFTNRGQDATVGINAYHKKLELLFDRTANVDVQEKKKVIGIPRCLNMYEEYPFWHTLFSEAGIEVVLSAQSSYKSYEKTARLVMSDNICFPAKLVHSHIQNLIEKKVDRIFMPFVVFERQDGGSNSYNCPIVSGYSEVVKSVQHLGVPIDSPAINFKDNKLLYKQCAAYLKTLGINDKDVITRSYKRAIEAEKKFGQDITEFDKQLLEESKKKGELSILLAGRPYHADPLIQHKLSDMIASMGANVITDDIVRNQDIELSDTHFVSQWAYTNRILKASKWVATESPLVQCMEMTSFGCGPDAFLTDESRNILKRHGKALTLLKIDDVNNIGSIKLRVRSVIESLRLSLMSNSTHANALPFESTSIFRKSDAKKKIIVPFFSPFLSPLIPSLMRLAGYDVENLPVSDDDSCDLGLKYANNEVCYPATLIVGDIVKAFESGRYNPENTAVAITQTGGQCRASNYLTLIKRALTEAGYSSVPVVSLTFGVSMPNEQPGFKVNWLKLLPIVLTSVLYSDAISKFYYSSVVREKKKGESAKLKDKYLNLASEAILHKSSKKLLALLSDAIDEFNSITDESISCPRVGVVGEIYLKFNPFAQRKVCDWLISHDIEVVPPLITNFFLQGFVNYIVRQDSYLKDSNVPDIVIRWLYRLVWRKVEHINNLCSKYSCFTPFTDVFTEAKEASGVITLNAQFGEGWLLPGEIMSLHSHGVTHVISLQPFGCIANHIIVKGIEKKLKTLCPDLSLLSLDFDSGVSDVNIVNRLLLFIDDLKNASNDTIKKVAK